MTWVVSKFGIHLRGDAMLDIQNERLCLLCEAAKEVPGRPHVSTLIRWWQRGVRGVKLETVVVGGRRYTSVEAINRFIARLSEPGGVPAPPVRQQQSEIDRELDRMGIR
jgi:hypothetical protein